MPFVNRRGRRTAFLQEEIYHAEWEALCGDHWVAGIWGNLFCFPVHITMGRNNGHMR